MPHSSFLWQFATIEILEIVFLVPQQHHSILSDIAIAKGDKSFVCACDAYACYVVCYDQERLVVAIDNCSVHSCASCYLENPIAHVLLWHVFRQKIVDISARRNKHSRLQNRADAGH